MFRPTSGYPQFHNWSVKFTEEKVHKKQVQNAIIIIYIIKSC
jgi:hypothetical protein